MATKKRSTTRRPAKKQQRSTPRRTAATAPRPALLEELRGAHLDLLRASRPGRLVGRAFAAVADQSIEFTITWNGTATAGLDHLVYNGVLVDQAETGSGRISVRFTRPLEAAHVFEWTLLFPGDTVTDLVATAALGGGAPEALASAAKADTRWQASGKV